VNNHDRHPNFPQSLVKQYNSMITIALLQQHESNDIIVKEPHDLWIMLNSPN
jgi:hypothetical protein